MTWRSRSRVWVTADAAVILLCASVLLWTGRLVGATAQPEGSVLASQVCRDSAGKPSSAAVDLQDGIRLADQKQDTEAAGLFVDTLQADPDCAQAYYRLGLIRLRRGDINGAIEVLGKALQIIPNYADAQLRLADALLELARNDQKYVDKAAVAYRRALELDPNQPEAYFNLGFLAAEKGDFQRAAAEYRKTLALDPDYPKLKLNLGICFYRQGDFGQAYNFLREAIATTPESPEAHYYLGLALVKRREWAAATRELRSTIQLEPGNREAHYALAEALRNSGRAKEAAAEFNIVVHMERNDTRLLRARFLNSEAERMTEAGEWDQAISDLRQSLKLNNDAKTATKLGCALLSKGDAEAAAQVLRRALQIDPSYVWAYYYLGVAFAHERKYDQARQALGAALKLKPDFPEATFYLGLTYAGQRQFQEAEPYLRSAVRMRPDAAPARYYLGLVLEQLGRTAEGEAELQVCHLLEPGYEP